jgi:D-glucosaminate-specific PTS system IIB component
MTDPTLIRVDFRLLHGMVATNWVRSLNIKNIYIIDDNVKNDQFLKEVYELAKPEGTEVYFLGLDEAVKQWNGEGYEGPSGPPALLLIKNIYNAKKLYDAGMKFHRILIGNSEVNRQKKCINNVYYFDEKDAGILNDLESGGVEITLQELVMSKSTTWEKIYRKYFE